MQGLQRFHSASTFLSGCFGKYKKLNSLAFFHTVLLICSTQEKLLNDIET